MVKELESKRMNFLQQRRAAFTYRTMLILLVGWCVLLMAAYGFEIVRGVRAKADVAHTRKLLEKLTAEKDAQLQVMEVVGRERMGSSAKEDLTAILTMRPHWSRVLKQLTKKLPAQVWLSSVKVDQERGGGEPRLEISGKTKTQRELTNFIMALESGGFFRRTELGKTRKLSKKEEAFEYDIVTTPILSKF